jgi:hypothetical protein
METPSGEITRRETMKTKRVPKRVAELMQSLKSEFERRQASGLRHIKATASKTSSGGKPDALPVSVTCKAYEAIMWLDAAFIGTPDYMGMAWFWNYEYRHYLRDATHRQRQRVHAALLKAGLPVEGESDEHEAIILKATR